jgi:hypothetical protein
MCPTLTPIRTGYAIVLMKPPIFVRPSLVAFATALLAAILLLELFRWEETTSDDQDWLTVAYGESIY